MKNAASQTNTRLVASIITKRVEYDHKSLKSNDNSFASIGNIIDEHLVRCARDGIVIEDITLHFEDEQWSDFAYRVRDSGEGNSVAVESPHA